MKQNGMGSRLHARHAVSVTVLLMVGWWLILTCNSAWALSLVQPWAPIGPKLANIKTHDLAVFIDPADSHAKLMIAEGSAVQPGQVAIQMYDGATGILATDFVTPPATQMNYGPVPLYWRSLAVFNGTVFAGLGDEEAYGGPTGPVLSGQVWMRIGPNNWQLVLQTDQTDVYREFVWNNELYAGVGSNSTSGVAELWRTADGLNWNLVQSFPAYGVVRSLHGFAGKLMFGMKNPAELFQYDGHSTITDLGRPPLVSGALSQLKSLVPSPDGSLLYVGCLPGYIYTWDPVNGFQLSADLTNRENAIYAGTVYANTVFFPTEGKAQPIKGGRIYALVGGQWIEQYTTPTGYGQLQVLLPYQPTGSTHAYIYAGGTSSSGYPNHLLRARYRP
jgi:hypothetical protein